MTAVMEKFALPHSLEAERAVLGSVLRDSETLNIVADRLVPEHFFHDAHRTIFQAMVELYHRSEPTDIVTLAEQLRRLNAESDYLGPNYLVELMESAPVAQNIDHYASIVRDYFYVRRIMDACQSTLRKAQSFDGRLTGFVEDIEKEFLAVTNSQDRTGLVTADKVIEQTLIELEERINNDGKLTGVPSEFVDLDRVTGGWQKSDLIILAARPGMGKTAFALNCIVNAVKQNVPTAVFTLEMSKTQLMNRILSSESRVESTKFRKGGFSEEELDRLMHGLRDFTPYNELLAIDETPGISLLELRSRCRRFKKERGLGFVVIDYLQLMTPSGSKRLESREREISEISGGLKALAKELQIPIMALAQLNRGPDARPDKVPKLSDIRESGSMEQDADMILFLYRDEYYNKDSEDAGKALVKIAKNRHGAQEEIYLAFAPNFLKFTNLQVT